MVVRSSPFVENSSKTSNAASATSAFVPSSPTEVVAWTPARVILVNTRSVALSNTEHHQLSSSASSNDSSREVDELFSFFGAAATRNSASTSTATTTLSSASVATRAKELLACGNESASIVFGNPSDDGTTDCCVAPLAAALTPSLNRVATSADPKHTSTTPPTAGLRSTKARRQDGSRVFCFVAAAVASTAAAVAHTAITLGRPAASEDTRSAPPFSSSSEGVSRFE